MAVALGNGLPTRLVILALHCLSCSALPGCSVSQHFQCSATPTLDCSDFPLTLLSFVCLFAHLSACACVSSDAPGSDPPRRGPPHIGPPQLGSSAKSPSARSPGLAPSSWPRRMTFNRASCACSFSFCARLFFCFHSPAIKMCRTRMLGISGARILWPSV